MGINLTVKETAELEITEIIDWYDFKKQGLGDRFYKELLNEFERIAKTPKIYSYYKKDFRKAALKRFLYLIIYKITEVEIIVYSIIHGGSNPKLIDRKIS